MFNNLVTVRCDFPILSTRAYGKPLIYLDNAATCHVPVQVVSAISDYYKSSHANVHRSAHYLSGKATARTHKTRMAVKDYIGAREPAEIIFTSGSTQAINLVACSIRGTLKPGDEVLVTEMEHHSNFCPWQNACQSTGADFKVIPFDDCGNLQMDAFRKLLTKRTRLVAVTYCSNVIGTVNHIEQITRLAHEFGAKVFVDAAQMMRHAQIDVQKLDCEFLCFSGHKMMAPTGIGVLYGKRTALESLAPLTVGGGMVDTVSISRTTYGELPFRLEAGTPNIAGIIGLEAAINYMIALGRGDIAAFEKSLTDYTKQRLGELSFIKIIGNPFHSAGVVSFTIEGVHSYDAAALLDRQGIAVRSGSHCAMPLLSRFGLDSVIRVSPAFYNTTNEIDALIDGIEIIYSLIRKG